MSTQSTRKFHLIGAILFNAILGVMVGIVYLALQPKKLVQMEVPIINKVTLDFDVSDGPSIASSEKVPYEFDEKKVSNTFAFSSHWFEIDDAMRERNKDDSEFLNSKYYRYDVFYTIANQYINQDKFYDALDKLWNDYTALSELTNTIVGRYEVPYLGNDVDLSKDDHMSGEFYIKTNEKEIIEVEEDKTPAYKKEILKDAMIGAGVAQVLLIPEVIRHTIKKKKKRILMPNNRVYKENNMTKQEEIKQLYTDMYRSKDALRIYRWIHYLLITIISGCVCYSLLPKYTQEEVPVTYKIEFAGDSNNGISILNKEQVEYSREPGANKYINSMTRYGSWGRPIDFKSSYAYDETKENYAYARRTLDYLLPNEYYDYDMIHEVLPTMFSTSEAESYLLGTAGTSIEKIYYSDDYDPDYSIDRVYGTIYATSDEKVIREIEPTVDKKDLAIGTAVGGIGGSIVLMGLENIIPGIRNWKKKKKDTIKKSLERLQVLENIEDTMSTQNK